MTFKEVLKEKVHHDLGFDFYVKKGIPSTFRIINKSVGILCGMIFIPTILEIVEKEFFLKPLGVDTFPAEVQIYAHKLDGELINPGDILAELRGDAEVLLKAERTILNILQELSGAATYTRKRMNELGNQSVFLLDTRKIDAIDRPMIKYAIRIGGAKNHRMGLYDGMLIKDNDIVVYGGVKQAIEKRLAETRFLTKVEIEVGSLALLREVLDDGRVDVIMLDNMAPAKMAEAVKMILDSGKPYLIEGSGISGLDFDEAVFSGVGYISTSTLVKKAEDLDISMKAVEKE